MLPATQPQKKPMPPAVRGFWSKSFGEVGAPTMGVTMTSKAAIKPVTTPQMSGLVSRFGF